MLSCWQKKAKAFSEKQAELGTCGKLLFFVAHIDDGFVRDATKLKQKNKDFQNFDTEFQQFDLQNHYCLTAHGELFRPLVYYQTLAGFDHTKLLLQFSPLSARAEQTFDAASDAD